MENQELFDRYILGELSNLEKQEFDNRLKADKSFADDFAIYLLVVKGIQKEEEQDCAEFGIAMRNMSKEELQEIIGVKAKPQSKPKAKKNTLKFSPWLYSIISAAAMIVVVITISLNLINQSQSDLMNTQYMAYNIIADYNFIDGGYRGGSDMLIKDFTIVVESELKEKLPLYESNYKQAQDEQDIKDFGLNLAMIYLKLHEKDKALDILKELHLQYTESDCEFAQQCQNIITQIEKI